MQIQAILFGIGSPHFFIEQHSITGFDENKRAMKTMAAIAAITIRNKVKCSVVIFAC